MSQTYFSEKKLITSPSQTTIIDALKTMNDHSIHHLVITENDKTIGVVSQSNISQWMTKNADRQTTPFNEPIKSALPPDFVRLPKDSSLEAILEEVAKPEISAVLLMDNDCAYAIVTESDLLRLMQKIIKTQSEPSLTEKSELLIAENPFAQKVLSLFDALGI